MATVINNPSNDGGNNMAMIVGIVLLVVVGVLFFIYGLPLLKQAGSQSPINITVPDKIDVNLNQTGGGTAPVQPGQ